MERTAHKGVFDIFSQRELYEIHSSYREAECQFLYDCSCQLHKSMPMKIDLCIFGRYLVQKMEDSDTILGGFKLNANVELELQFGKGEQKCGETGPDHESPPCSVALLLSVQTSLGKNQYRFCGVQISQNQKNFIKILSSKKFVIRSGFHEKYLAVKKIGEGSSAHVYLIKSRHSGQLKVAKGYSKKSLSKQKAFMKEFKFLTELKHPYLIKLKEAFSSENTRYLVTEYLPQSLSQCLYWRENLSFMKQKMIMIKLLKAVACMHSSGYVHLDIKPGNILMKAGQPVLIDFGFTDTPENLMSSSDKLYGTPGFLAPEIFEDMTGKFTPACDIFSLGATFFIIMTGRQLFVGTDQDQVAKNNKKCEINFEEGMFAYFNNEEKDFFKGLLSKNPKQRFTAREALHHQFFNINKMLVPQCPTITSIE